eukprot:Phypoly_transcript_00846.p1 GENE.Phypoly_transcript_00846~~Phypoly_transcript_00846.p1  ORF type:complete len:1283 (+),score=292.23 Phypoly_transcript_00846:83-3931(+)
MAESVAVMVHAIEARDLKPQNSSGMIDPILSIEVLGEKRFTPKFTKDLAPYFGHYFQVESDKVRDFASETLVVSVFDTGTLFRKELIGSFSFDLAEVHARPNHEYFRVWTLLTSQDKTGKASVRGYLRLSVTVLRPGDIPAQHDEPDDDETDAEEEDLSKMVLLKPKGLDGVDNVLRAKFFRAENLPKMDAIGSVDPLVELKFGTNKKRTSTIKSNYNPQWMEEIQLPVILPTVADNVVVRVMDFDGVGKDELITQRVISLKEIQNPTDAGKNWSIPGWINLYRGKGSQGEFQDYAGRVLASFSVLQAEAKVAVVKTGNEAEPPTTPYSIAFDLFEIQGLHKGEYYVVVSIGNQQVKSTKRKGLSEKEHAGGLIEFYENVPDLDVVFPQDTSQVPDIFVYVYEDVPGDDKRIGYLRYTYAQFSKLGPNPRWETLKRKSSDSKDDENFNVSVQFKATISTQKGQRAKIVKQPKKFYQLRAHIFLGANLPAGDEDALSDPYLTVTLGGARKKTKTQEHTIYPDWYETVLLDVELPETFPPDIQLSVFDYDSVSSDEFLGRVTVPLPKPSSSQAVPEPQWYRMALRDQIPGRGEILASFQLFPQESKNVPLPQLRPPTIDAEIDLGIVGLKELAPFNLLPVSNPYIKFSVGGSKHAAQTRSVKGSRGNAGFFENVKISAALPENGMFIPALLVEVFDKRPIKDVMVGTTSIPLAPFAPWIPQDKKVLAKFVDLPPVVPEEQFYQPQSVEPLPGPPAEIKQDSQVIIQIDEPEKKDGGESQSLLDKGKGKAENSLKEIRRDIPTTTVPGTEDEPEPPQPPQLPTELEHNLRRFPFVEMDLYRGTSAGVSSGNLFNRPDTVSGKIKGSISIKSSKASGSSKKPDPVVDVTQIAKTRPYVLRVYIETGHNLVPHDDNGYSDPYIVLSAGRQVIKDKENVKEKTLQPEYYKMYTFRGNLPEENELKVQLYDKDTIGSDEFMGETKYDLEMLWFSDEWRKLNPKPKEFRTLWSNLSSFPQGKLKMWIELLTPEEAAAQEPYPIAPPRKEPFELRIIVWETKNVVPKDKILGKDSSDQFVVTKLLNHAQSQQQTDVHDSVMDGCGKFNWRIIYSDIMLPYDIPRLKVQVYDKDHIGPNDAIAEANLNLKGFFQKGLRNGSAKIGLLTNVNNLANQTMQITNTSKEGSNTAGPYNSGQWLDLYHPSFEGVQGTLCAELELLTREEALKKPAGRGRGEPNQNPFLPEPVRPKREWFSDLFKFLGLDKFKKYIIIGCIILAVVLVLFIILYFAL